MASPELNFVRAELRQVLLQQHLADQKLQSWYSECNFPIADPRQELVSMHQQVFDYMAKGWQLHLWTAR
jgi:hypothetical protein